MPVIKHDQENKSVDKTVAKFNTTALQTANNAKLEHGSRQFAGAPKFDKSAVDYGRPLTGTRSQARGVRGGEHVMREVIFLCEMIEQNGEGIPPDCYIKFGPLFYMYSRISETLVGMLIRARKYGLLDFEGEMLYQRQDDHKKIRLLMSSAEINQSIEYTGDPVNIIKFNNGKIPPPPAPRALLPPDAAPPPVFSLGPTKKQSAKASEGTAKEQTMPETKIVPTMNKQQASGPPVVPKKPMPATEAHTQPKAVLNGTTTPKASSNGQTAPKGMQNNQTAPKAMANGQTAPKEALNEQTVPKAMPKTTESTTNKLTSPVKKVGNKAAPTPPVFCVSFVGK